MPSILLDRLTLVQDDAPAGRAGWPRRDVADTFGARYIVPGTASRAEVP